jgi:hypothetical protein
MLKWLCFKVWIVHELDCVTSDWTFNTVRRQSQKAYVAVQLHRWIQPSKEYELIENYKDPLHFIDRVQSKTIFDRLYADRRIDDLH